MSDIQLQLLKLVHESGEIANTLQEKTLSQYDSNTLHSNLTSLWSKEMITFNKIEVDSWALTAEAESYVSAGATPEVQVVDEVLKALEGLTISGLKEKLGPIGLVGQGKASFQKQVVE